MIPLPPSLFISPYQNHELLREVAERAAAEYGVTFLYRDFRPLFRAGQERGELGMYIQKYCGCVFLRRSATSRRRKFCGKRLPWRQAFLCIDKFVVERLVEFFPEFLISLAGSRGSFQGTDSGRSFPGRRKPIRSHRYLTGRL